jgi:hypothetical protein
MTLAQSVIEAVEWRKVSVLRGTGSELAASLRDFVAAATPEKASELWWGLEGVAFAQNTIYGGAEPAVAVMMAALVDRPPIFLREWIMEALRFILSGDSDVDSSLAGRCRESALRGVWLLAAEANETEDAGYREAVLEVLAHIDPAAAQVVLAGIDRDH